MKRMGVAAEAAACDGIALLLEGIWETPSWKGDPLCPAYRAMTGFLLGIRLLERFGVEAIEDSDLVSIRLPKAPYEAKALSQWSRTLKPCLAQPGYHPMEGLMLAFHHFYRRIEADPSLRCLDGREYTVEEWAANAIALVLWLDEPRLFQTLRTAWLREARVTQDWLTWGLSSLDSWWDPLHRGGVPGQLDLAAVVLSAPYAEASLERLAMARLFTEIKAEGMSTEWGGDLDGSILLAYRKGYELASANRELCHRLLLESAQTRNVSPEKDMAGLLALYRAYLPTDDPDRWEANIAEAARAYTSNAVTIAYLPPAARNPSFLRTAVDFGFWAGMAAWEVGVG